jgi:hypothetical protein
MRAPSAAGNDCDVSFASSALPAQSTAGSENTPEPLAIGKLPHETRRIEIDLEAILARLAP